MKYIIQLAYSIISNLTSERCFIVPCSIEHCVSNQTHVAVTRHLNMYGYNGSFLITMEDNSPHNIGQVFGSEMEFGLGTNMLSVVSGTILKIKQWTYLLE